MTAYELVAKIEEVMGNNGKGGWPIVLQVDHDFGGDFEIKDVTWNEEEQRFEIEA